MGPVSLSEAGLFLFKLRGIRRYNCVKMVIYNLGIKRKYLLRWDNERKNSRVNIFTGSKFYL